MRNLITTLALLAAVAPSVALADPIEHRFTHRGVTYTYTVTDAAGGRQVIEGRSQPGGSNYRLIVSGDRVEGVSGGQPVSFRTPRQTGITLASR